MRKDPVPNLSPLWPSVLPKMAKNNYLVFLQFCVFGHFDLQNDLQIQIWPDPPNIIWGCPIFSILWFFCQATPYALKFGFKYNSNIFSLFLTFLFDFSQFFTIFFFCIHILAAGLRTESVLVPSRDSLSLISDFSSSASCPFQVPSKEKSVVLQAFRQPVHRGFALLTDRL